MRHRVLAAALVLAAFQVNAQDKVLRVVPHSNLNILDPVWTTQYMARNHGYMVYDTLFGTDEKSRIQPQMVDKWTSSPNRMRWSFTLRDGLKFHDGQAVTAEDCVLSLRRWGQKDSLGRLLMAATGKLAAVDAKTFTLELKEPFGPVLDALGKPPIRASDREHALVGEVL